MFAYYMLELDQQRRILIAMFTVYCIYDLLNLYLRCNVLTRKGIQIVASHSVYIEILYLQFIELVSKIYCISYNFLGSFYLSLTPPSY